ncbi:MAG: hypothetical protein J07HN4v3_02144 [Halonotius sp. J07HN4]|nr:MAG: hypothetical protein J07HN4v3_02144 [Halonotius sp. J07HN4]
MKGNPPLGHTSQNATSAVTTRRDGTIALKSNTVSINNKNLSEKYLYSHFLLPGSPLSYSRRLPPEQVWKFPRLPFLSPQLSQRSDSTVYYQQSSQKSNSIVCHQRD